MSLSELPQYRALVAATVGLGFLFAGRVTAKRAHCRADCEQDVAAYLAVVPSNATCTGTRARRESSCSPHTCRGHVTVRKKMLPHVRREHFAGHAMALGRPVRIELEVEWRA
jgi:hypothetical protein